MKQHKIVITGTGRSGTTIIMALLSLLGYDTGYSREDVANPIHYDPKCNAGLELSWEDCHYIHKQPLLQFEFFDKYEIDHIIVPIRKMEDSARSRERMHKMGEVAGGFVCCDNYERQLQIYEDYMKVLFRFIYDRKIPSIFIKFPKFIQDDGSYLFKKLCESFKDLPNHEYQFKQEFKNLIKPELIHF